MENFKIFKNLPERIKCRHSSLMFLATTPKIRKLAKSKLFSVPNLSQILMSRLRLEKLHVDIQKDESQLFPRRYTLTHSDSTGDLYLTVADDYNREQISGWYTRIMRDEVLAEWQRIDEDLSLHVYCHISGGLVLGGAGMREAIFRREMPLVLEAIRNGDSEFFENNPEFDKAPIILHYQKSGKYYKTEGFGVPSDFALKK
jgi:hypothetical protein